MGDGVMRVCTGVGLCQAQVATGVCKCECKQACANGVGPLSLPPQPHFQPHWAEAWDRKGEGGYPVPQAQLRLPECRSIGRHRTDVAWGPVRRGHVASGERRLWVPVPLLCLAQG